MRIEEITLVVSLCYGVKDEVSMGKCESSDIVSFFSLTFTRAKYKKR